MVVLHSSKVLLLVINIRKLSLMYSLGVIFSIILVSILIGLPEI